ncbi:GHMP family kinase ATP-binding protein [Bacillus wiedmannii]|uniref:GHMP family kinase ATP-binding protein n=1 Tax=Bacillus wiedmannii TaxID=1890302 RepID=UPI000BF03199|nr:kinase [Bacillus wiedmannii]PEM18979.1 kinase [Bacillus wiedmannii]
MEQITTMRSVICESNGTFGELLQGVLLNDKNFLVTLPIKLSSKALFFPDTKSSEVFVYPQRKEKVKMAVKLILKEININTGGTLIIDSNIPEGKGLASSSADISAALKAILHASDYVIEPKILEDIMRKIEPTDGIMYDECVSFYHKEVELHQKLGQLPSMLIIGIDEGGTVNTIDFNKGTTSYSFEEKVNFQKLISELEAAIFEQDLYKIGSISTRSSILNQKKLFKKNLDLFLEFNSLKSVCGTVVAHSGTMIGTIVKPDACTSFEDIKVIITKLQSLSFNPQTFLNYSY